MKNTALQLTNDYIHDFKNCIEGNVADHLISTLENVESYYEYLSDEEIEEYYSATQERVLEIRSEIENWIKNNFNFYISEFKY